MSGRDEAIQRALGRSLVSPDRLALLWDHASRCAALGGAIVEVGAYKGGTATLLRSAMPNVPMWIFDTFAGHPEPSAHDHSAHPAGRFGDTSLESVRALFDGEPNQPTFVVGEFPHSLAGIELPALAFVHVDVDLYGGTLAAFERLWPLLQVGGVMVCDDYGFGDCPGAKLAVEEFVARTPGASLDRPGTLQAVVTKVAA